MRRTLSNRVDANLTNIINVNVCEDKCLDEWMFFFHANTTVTVSSSVNAIFFINLEGKLEMGVTGAAGEN